MTDLETQEIIEEEINVLEDLIYNLDLEYSISFDDKILREIFEKEQSVLEKQIQYENFMEGLGPIIY